MVLKIILLFIISFSTYASQSTKIANVVHEKIASELSLGLELDTYRISDYIAPSIEYVTVSKLSVSVSSQNVPVINHGAQSFEKDTYLSISKFVKLTDKFAFIAGTQNGTVFGSGMQLHNFDFIDLRFRPVRGIVFHAGPYYVNKHLSMTSNQIGVESGIELYNDTFKFNFDYISGKSNISGGSATITYNVNSAFGIYGGVGVPAPNSGNEFYGIFGVSYSLGF